MTRSPVLLVAVALLLGCVSAKVEPSSGRLGELRPGEAIAVLLNRYQEGEDENKHMVSSVDAAEIERELGHCLAEALRTRAPELRVIEPSEFAERVFPGVPLQRVPRSPESIVDLASNPEFRARTQALGVRFIVIATGATQMPSQGGGGCFGGFGVGGCLVLVIWDRDSQLAALVLDLESGKAAQGPSVTT